MAESMQSTQTEEWLVIMTGFNTYGAAVTQPFATQFGPFTSEALAKAAAAEIKFECGYVTMHTTVVQAR